MTIEVFKKAVDNMATAFEEYKKTNDERLAALASGKDAGELGAKLDRIEKDVSKWNALKAMVEKDIEAQSELKDRLEELEAKSKAPGRTVADKLNAEYKENWVEWVRAKGQSAQHEAKMQELSKKAIEAKAAVTIATPSAGGFAVPEEISTMIEVLEKKFSPVRDLVKVVKVGTGDYKELVNIRGTTSGWVGESTSRTATDASLLRERAPTNGELYAYPQASEWSLDDMFFNVEQWLAEEVAQSFAIAEGLAVIEGNGTNSPTGMLNTAPVSTADFASPLRAAAAYQFIPSLSPSSPAVAEIVPDALIDLIYSLNSAYRSGAQFVMNSNTIGAVRKLKDTNGQYHWQPGLQQGQPDRLLGYGLSPWEQMPDIGTNELPIGFGNWKRAYVLAERIGLRMTRDNVTTIGFVKFYMRRREGGTVLNNDAAKFLKTTVA